MKKIYVLVASVAVTGVASAQLLKSAPQKDAMHSLGRPENTRDVANYHSFTKAGGQVLFSDDFANLSEWTTAGPDGAIWMHDTDGPNGAFSSQTNADIIASTTVANGFAMFDADLSNPTTPYVNRVGYLVSPIVNMTGIAGATLRFEHRYRNCCDNTFAPKVQVSTDGFATFTTFDVSIPGTDVNALPNTSETKVNLAGYLATATNLNNFQFRFAFDGSGTPGTSHYFWQVDDVSLFESYSSDLTLSSAFFTVGDLAIPYYQIPSTQLPAEVTFHGFVKNSGTSVQPNTMLTGTLGAQSVDSDPVSIAVGTQTDSLGAASITTPTTVGSLAVTYSVASDSTDAQPGDNLITDASSFNITNTVFGVDNMLAAGQISQLASQDGSPLQIGNQMEIFADTRIDSMYIGVTTAAANVGQEIFGAVFLWDGTTFSFLAETDPFEITTATNGTMIKLPISGGPVDVDAGSNILVVAGHFGGTTEVAFRSAQKVEQGVVLGFDASNALFSLTNPRALMVRINANPSASTDKLVKDDLLIGNIFPNPTTGNSAVHVTLDNTADVTVSVLDVAGKVIATQHEGTLAAGAHTLNVDAAAFATGVYYIKVQAGSTVATKKLIKK